MQTVSNSGHAPVNGINMYYEIYGEGAMPLVLIHGGGSTIQSSFGAMIPLLVQKYKLVAVELQAHGRTSDRTGPESFTQDADDVAALLKILNIEQANILGFSNGGSTALQLAIRHPALVHKIVPVAAAYKREGLVAGFFEGMPKATLKDMPAPLKEAFLKVTPDEHKLQTMFEKDKQRMIDFKDWPDEELKAIKAQALLIVGDRDVITVAHTLKMSQLIPNARLIVLPGVHGECIGEICTARAGSSQPGITVALVEEFLKE